MVNGESIDVTDFEVPLLDGAANLFPVYKEKDGRQYYE